MLSPGIMTGRLRLRWWSIAAVLCSVGCGTSTSYHVEIRPTAEGFVRTVDVASHPRPEPQADEPADQLASEDEPADQLASDEERKVFLAIYGESTRGSESERFENTFAEDTPDDVGGSGSLIRWSSELGDTLVYHERFRGKLPTLRERIRREATIDQVIRWASGWLDEELAREAGADEVKQFVANDLRTDLQDLMCLLEVTASSVPERSSENRERPLLLLAHFLIERGYLSFADLAELPLNDLSENEKLDWVVERFRRKLVRSTGLPVDAPPLQRLSEPEALAHRFTEFLRGTREYRLWRDERLSADAAGSVKPSEFLGEFLEPVVGPLFVGLLGWQGVDELTLVLHTEAEPLETNGRWDKGTGSVRWQWRLRRRSTLPKEVDWLYSGLPQVAFAEWVRADQTRQSALFGKVLIRDAALRDYCQWRRRLGKQQAARWQELLEQLPRVAAADRIEWLTGFKEQWTEEFDVAPPVVDQMISGLSASSQD